MLFVAVILALGSASFYYAANTNSSLANSLCFYGDTFCQHPTLLAAAAIIALLWGALLKVDRI